MSPAMEVFAILVGVIGGSALFVAAMIRFATGCAHRHEIRCMAHRFRVAEMEAQHEARLAVVREVVKP